MAPFILYPLSLSNAAFKSPVCIGLITIKTSIELKLQNYVRPSSETVVLIVEQAILIVQKSIGTQTLCVCYRLAPMCQ